MPSVIGPDGKILNVPPNVNGKELKNSLNIPTNRILTRKDNSGKETVVKNDDNISLGENDQLGEVTQFARGTS